MTKKTVSPKRVVSKKVSKKTTAKKPIKKDVFFRNEKKQFHRTDGPAVELANGTKEWYLNGQLHRTDGPAVEWFNVDTLPTPKGRGILGSSGDCFRKRKSSVA